MLLLFSVCGFLGGLLCCVGDVLFDLKGPGNQKLGTSGNIDSNWLKMAEWRFGASILCAAFGDVGVALGFCSISEQLRIAWPQMSVAILVLGVAGSTGGLFIHAVLCLQAIIYKRVMAHGEGAFEIADDVLEGMCKAILVPFFLLYAVLMVGTICVSVAVGCGALGCPTWMWPLNSVVLLVIGALFRKVNPALFQDLPGIIMPSLGLAMVGFVGVIALLG